MEMLPLAMRAAGTGRILSCTQPPHGAVSAEIRRASGPGTWAYVGRLNRIKRPHARSQGDTADRSASNRIIAFKAIGRAKCIFVARKTAVSTVADLGGIHTDANPRSPLRRAAGLAVARHGSGTKE